MLTRKLRMGMIGGGKDGFIGAIHRIAAFMDGHIELVCGALSLNPEIAMDYPKVDEGIRGMAFIESVVESGQSDKKWITHTS